MGTRSLTTFIETYTERDTGKKKKNEVVTMYRQYDGYPSGHGKELAEFLADGKVVNGYGLDGGKQFNGIGCLAAQVVAHFKDGVGGFYLQRGNKDSGEEYRYHVIHDYDKGTLTIKVMEVGYVNKKDEYVNKTRTIFNGSPAELAKAVQTEVLT
jgi:hypothetical protein